MFLSRVFSIPVRFFIALLVCFPWELLGRGGVTAPVPEFSSPALIPYPSNSSGVRVARVLKAFMYIWAGMFPAEMTW